MFEIVQEAYEKSKTWLNMLYIDLDGMISLNFVKQILLDMNLNDFAQHFHYYRIININETINFLKNIEQYLVENKVYHCYLDKHTRN